MALSKLSPPQGHSLLRSMSMLMLMFNFLKVSSKYGSTRAHSHTLGIIIFLTHAG